MTPPRRSREGPGPSTTGVHAGGGPTLPGGPVVPPIVQSSTFFSASPGDEREPLYTRYGTNPNQMAVGEKIAALEGTEAALTLASGMAATAMTFLAVLRKGDHVVASRHLYGATRRLLAEEFPRRGIQTTFVEPGTGRGWRQALRSKTRLIFLEVPTNPTLRVFDPRPVAKLAREAGVLLVVDATFASPVNLRPAELGADVVIHSGTKYLGGHSDLVAGVVAGPRALVEEVREMLKLYGPALDPHAAWLLERGLRTLAVRVERHNRNAQALAEWFEEQPEVERVVYPGLSSHPDHRVATEIMDGYGGMLGVVLRGGGEAADAFCQALRIALVAPSLGGVETLVSQPRRTSHRGLEPAELQELGIPDGYVRISAGIEDVVDLISDFRQALDAVAGAGRA